MAETAQVANSIENTCARLSIGRTTFYDLVNAGRLKVFKLGRKTLVPESEIQRLVSEQLAQASRGGDA
jgi:excisionase family DNA binding protein